MYNISYETLMEKAGYIKREESGGKKQKAKPGRGRVATFATEDLTEDEEEELLKYLAFLRTRKK